MGNVRVSIHRQIRLLGHACYAYTVYGPGSVHAHLKGGSPLLVTLHVGHCSKDSAMEMLREEAQNCLDGFPLQVRLLHHLLFY